MFSTLIARALGLAPAFDLRLLPTHHRRQQLEIWDGGVISGSPQPSL